MLTSQNLKLYSELVVLSEQQIGKQGQFRLVLKYHTSYQDCFFEVLSMLVDNIKREIHALQKYTFVECCIQNSEQTHPPQKGKKML